MISLLLDLWDELRLFWTPRPTRRKGFNPARPMDATQARRLACGGTLRGNA